MEKDEIGWSTDVVYNSWRWRKRARMGITDLHLVMTDNAFDPQDAPPHPSHQQDEIGWSTDVVYNSWRWRKRARMGITIQS